MFLLGGILILFLLSVFFLFWQENMLPDVSVADVAAGKDMQGIPWEKMLFGRDQYREMKMKNYRNYQNLSYAREDALQVLTKHLSVLYFPDQCLTKITVDFNANGRMLNSLIHNTNMAQWYRYSAHEHHVSDEVI